MKKIGLSGVLLAAGLAYAGAASADVKMGVAGPITGPNASFGAQLTNGVAQAAADFNKPRAASSARKSTSSQGDDVSDPKQGVCRSPTSSSATASSWWSDTSTPA